MTDILKAFLRSITGNDILKTNNNDYSCVDEFMASDEYKELKIETIPKKNRCGFCKKIVPKGYQFCNAYCYNGKN